MEKNEALENGGNTIIAIIFFVVIAGVFMLAMAVLFNALTSIDTSTNGYVTSYASTTNESGSANSTGYTLASASTSGFKNPALVLVVNATDMAGITANATIRGNKLYNATPTMYNKVNITYTWQYETTNSSANLGIKGIQGNTFAMIMNFFEMMPTIGTILAVVILIAVIVLLVLYVKRMKDSGSSEGTYTG